MIQALRKLKLNCEGFYPVRAYALHGLLGRYCNALGFERALVRHKRHAQIVTSLPGIQELDLCVKVAGPGTNVSATVTARSEMSNPYKAIFRERGAGRFAAAAFVARLPVAMAPIGIVTMLSQTHGEYSLAGAVAATFTLTNALAAPQISRLVDRFGQFRLVTPTTAVAVGAFALLMIAANLKWPTWTLFATALFAGSMPSVAAMVRARWTELFRHRPELNTAFAFESAADELVYIMGASLSVGLSVALFPEAGVLVSTLLLALGTTAFLLQRDTEPRIRQGEARSETSAILLRPVQLITLAMIFVGAIFATAEVSTVALTRDLGSPEAATLVIGVYASGSFVVGVIIGAMKLRTPLHRQFLVAVSTLLVTTFPLLAVDTVPTLAAAIFLSGIAVSPTFITAFGLVEQRVPPTLLTEGVTWVGTGIGVGMALGSFVAGGTVDTFGARSGFLVSVAAAMASHGIITAGQQRLAGEVS
jgi:MFS family permease